MQRELKLFLKYPVSLIYHSTHSLHFFPHFDVGFKFEVAVDITDPMFTGGFEHLNTHYYVQPLPAIFFLDPSQQKIQLF